MSDIHKCGVQQCYATLQQQPSETKYDWADLYKCNKCKCSIYICNLCYKRKPTSLRRNASIRFARHRLSRHNALHHSKEMIHVNKRAKLDTTAHKSISTSNIFIETGNDESTSTTTIEFHTTCAATNFDDDPDTVIEFTIVHHGCALYLYVVPILYYDIQYSSGCNRCNSINTIACDNNNTKIN